MSASQRLADAIRSRERLFAAALVVMAVVAWTAVGTSAWFVQQIVTDLPDDESLREIGAMAQSTTLYDRHDQPAFTIFQEQRIEVPIDRISPHLVDAILAIEDQRFFDHGGLDVVRIAAAAMTNLREGRAAQGGSTLTQQLARQSFLTSEKTIRRKLKEMVVAARLEGEFAKEQILELYLNKVYFGDGLYGVEAASRGYFGKPAADVDVAEAALLAGLVKAPSAYAPTVNLDRALARRQVVLQAMRDSGVIDAATHERAAGAPVMLSDSLRSEEAHGRFFKEEVRRQLVERFGWERVYQGGLKVYTTLDLEKQKAAEAEVAAGIEAVEQRQARSRRKGEAADGEPLQAALVAMDPRTGEIRAMVGGRSFDDSKFNRATQAQRQPGSAFKPFVYAAAIERGFSPGSLLTRLDEPTATPQGAWVPADGHSTASSMTMRTALRTSSNRAAVRMLNEVGIPVALRYVERLNVGKIPPVPSLALGSGEVTLLSMTTAYAAFANEGLVPVPTLIRRVEAVDGTVLWEGGGTPQRAVSEATAFLMSDMMADVINNGTAYAARRAGFTLPAAGKTGTTNDYFDAWFIGYTPSLVTGVWVGYDMPKTIIRDGYASQLAVPIWTGFMKAATKGDKKEWFKAPSTIRSRTICRISGKLATEACRRHPEYDRDGSLEFQDAAYTEHFVRGTEPGDYCDVHGVLDSHGLRALNDDGEPNVPVATSGTDEAADDEPEPEPSRRRGFWGRIFGR